MLRSGQYAVLQLVSKGKTEGHGRIGGRRTACRKNIQDWTGIETTEQFYRRTLRTLAILIANVRETGQGTYS